MLLRNLLACCLGPLLAPFVLSAPPYEWATPVRLTSATCTEFSGVSSLPLTAETVSLLKFSADNGLALPMRGSDVWSNGSGDEMLKWLGSLAEQNQPDTTLILYFSTHQLKDGNTRFTDGPDLEPTRLVDAINKAAGHYKRVLFINDSCYGTALERGGSFADNVIRLYSARSDELSMEFKFNKGPYGLEEFVEKERVFLRANWNWDPPGMGLLGIMGLKAGLHFREESPATIDLQHFVDELSRFRDLYNEEIRQARAQHLTLIPASANFDILKRSHPPE